MKSQTSNEKLDKNVNSQNQEKRGHSKKQKIYTKFQYKDQVFQVGDVCKFYNETRDLIGKILSIASTDQSHADFGKLRVQWYYYKSDLKAFKKLKLSEKDFNQICDQELFPTNHEDLVYVQSLNGKCTIVTLEQYESMPAANGDTFFIRAEFDVKHLQLKPKYDDWPKICSCQRPSNPSQTYIQCESCDNWYHPSCQNTTPDVESFICTNCNSK